MANFRYPWTRPFFRRAGLPRFEISKPTRFYGFKTLMKQTRGRLPVIGEMNLDSYMDWVHYKSNDRNTSTSSFSLRAIIAKFWKWLRRWEIYEVVFLSFKQFFYQFLKSWRKEYFIHNLPAYFTISLILLACSLRRKLLFSHDKCLKLRKWPRYAKKMLINKNNASFF